jgi:transposase
MIVIGIDAHKRSHTCVAVHDGTGRRLAARTVPARDDGLRAMLGWARRLDGGERVWAVEDCRHVTARLEKFLIARGERVVRVAPHLTGSARRGSREPGKSDPIDALAVARVAVREGVDTLPVAFLDPEALEIRRLGDHRERLVGQRTALMNDLRWQLHDLDPGFEVPLRRLTLASWQQRTETHLAAMPASVQVRIARDELDRIRALTDAINALQTEISERVASYRPALLSMPGCGPLTAAKVIGETAGAQRFATAAKFARITGTAPIPASSGSRTRHRLNRGGNRQLNAALHRIAVTQIRVHPPARAYLNKKLAEGKTYREALRCLKRQLAGTVWRLMLPTTPAAPPPQPPRRRRTPDTIICNAPI